MYDGSSTIIVALMVIIIKFVIFLIFIRIIFLFSIFEFYFWYFLKFISFFSIVIGSIGALTQQKIKRFIAFTSINQLGLMTLGVIFDPLSMIGSFSSLLVYISTNLIFFGVLLTIRESKKNKLLIYLSDLHNLFISSPGNGIYLTISILSMSGVPPFTGFFSKYFLILPIINNVYGIYFGFIILFFHVVSTFNYLRLLRDIWFYDLSKILSFYSYLNVINLFFFFFLFIFQVFFFLNFNYLIAFCSYLRFFVWTVNWCLLSDVFKF